MARTKAALAVLLTTLLGCKFIDKVTGDDSDEAVAAAPASAAPVNSGAASAPTTAVVTSSGKFEALPLEVGQMVRYVGKGESAGGFTYSVVGKEQGAFRLELASPSAIGETVTQLLLKIDPKRENVDDLKLLEAKVKAPNAPMITISAKQADMIGQLSQQIIKGLRLPDFDQAPHETVKVPAGVFEGSAKVETNEKLFGMQEKASSWHHPKVPITTMVKLEGTLNGKPTSMELVEYSLTAGKSKL
jgi:hypothetical protein